VLIRVLFLAVLQGVSEFLPISSSGHLVIAKHLLGLDGGAGIQLEVALHAGTLVSILYFYRIRILELCRGFLRREAAAQKYLVCIVVGSIPTVVVYVVLGDWFEAQFGRPLVAAFLLCVTGCALLSLRWLGTRVTDLSVGRALAVGVAQSLALLPGISRSGSTIVTARWLGLSARTAAEFSFLMSIPALGGAMAIEALKMLRGGGVDAVGIPALAVGFVVAAVVGVGALSVLIRVLVAERFWLFGVYCLIAGAVAAGLLLAGF
jgi:undecaprenyl-diphosphatase